MKALRLEESSDEILLLASGLNKIITAHDHHMMEIIMCHQIEENLIGTRTDTYGN